MNSCKHFSCTNQFCTADIFQHNLHSVIEGDGWKQPVTLETRTLRPACLLSHPNSLLLSSAPRVLPLFWMYWRNVSSLEALRSHAAPHSSSSCQGFQYALRHQLDQFWTSVCSQCYRHILCIFFCKNWHTKYMEAAFNSHQFYMSIGFVEMLHVGPH